VASVNVFYLTLRIMDAIAKMAYMMNAGSAKKTDIYEDYIPSNHQISVKQHSS